MHDGAKVQRQPEGDFGPAMANNCAWRCSSIPALPHLPAWLVTPHLASGSATILHDHVTGELAISAVFPGRHNDVQFAMRACFAGLD
jgi:hypothetical protein